MPQQNLPPIFCSCKSKVVAAKCTFCRCKHRLAAANLHFALTDICGCKSRLVAATASDVWLQYRHRRQKRGSAVLFPLRWFLSSALTLCGELRTQKVKGPSDESTELKGSPFKAGSRSVYSHSCYAYCQGSLPCSFQPFQSIHLHSPPKKKKKTTTLPSFSCVSCG